MTGQLGRRRAASETNEGEKKILELFQKAYIRYTKLDKYKIIKKWNISKKKNIFAQYTP